MKNKWEPQWHLIEFGQCPKCYKSLFHDVGWAAMRCVCGFSILDAKFKSMRSKLIEQRKQEEKLEAELLRKSGPTDEEIMEEFKKKWQ